MLNQFVGHDICLEDTKAQLGLVGVTFEMFKAFYYVLFGGSDLERAMFFLDKEKRGVLR